MVLDASTLLSRTLAGDAELRKPTNGLSLGQRKLLSFLDQPQALDELADEHALEREKLARDLAKLASLNLVAVDGQVREAAPTGVVIGGLRAPTVLRWLFPLLLVVSAAAIYFVMRAPAPHRPDTSSAIASESHTPPANAAPVAAASVTSAPEPAPVPTPVAALPPAPASSPLAHEKIAAATPTMAGADVRSTSATPPQHAAPDASKAVALPTRLQIEETAGEATHATPAPERNNEPSTIATPPSKATAAAQPSATRPDAAPAVAPASAPVISAPVAAPAAAAATGSPVVTSATAPVPVKLAMAAPSTAAAHPAVEARLLPLTRQDPEFPREAIVRGVSTGVVKARLAIDAGGHVSGVSIVDARPSRVFDRAVSDALSHWTFPAGDAGRSTEVEIAFHRD